MNKKGMTLLELLVYMALAALLLAPVIMLMNSSSKNMARDASNTDLRISGRDLLNIIYDDLKNTGFKLDGSTPKYEATYLDTGNTNAVVNDPRSQSGEKMRDSSSFIPYNDANPGRYDSLVVIKGKLSSNGGWVGADTIRYSVANQITTKELQRSESTTSPKTLARNVAALKFQYSSDLAEWYDFKVYDPTDGNDLYKKIDTKYIKVTLVLKDNKRLAATTNQRIVVNETQNVVITDDSQALYERHEIVVPIPNNGLYP